jgi:hypothetical protein
MKPYKSLFREIVYDTVVIDLINKKNMDKFIQLMIQKLKYKKDKDFMIGGGGDRSVGIFPPEYGVSINKDIYKKNNFEIANKMEQLGIEFDEL